MVGCSMLFIVYTVHDAFRCYFKALRPYSFSVMMHLAVHALPPWPLSFVVSLPTPQATASSADIIPTPHFLTTIFETDQFTGMSSECIGGIMGALCGVGVIWTVVAIVVRSKDSITRQVNPLTSYSATAVGLSRNNACPHMENVASMGWPAHRDYPICLGLSLAFTLSALFSGWERE